MRRLTKRKVVWIVRWFQRNMSTKDLALSQKVSQRRIQQLLKEYRSTGHVRFRFPGRPRKHVPIGHIRLILREHPRNSGAVILERKIRAKHNMHIPHNTIHMVLKHAGYAQPDPKKQKRRKWVRYEREHSLSLVHTDWHESKVVPGKQVIAYLDDASRFILAIEEWDRQTLENTLVTLRKAIAAVHPYGGIRQLLSDNGSQFLKEFNKELAVHGIEHVYTRVHHPQTNGKMERFFRTYEEKRGRFASLDAFMRWYNEERMHMSLNMRYAETPYEAFIRKLEQGIWLGMVRKWFI